MNAMDGFRVSRQPIDHYDRGKVPSVATEVSVDTTLNISLLRRLSLSWRPKEGLITCYQDRKLSIDLRVFGYKRSLPPVLSSNQRAINSSPSPICYP